MVANKKLIILKQLRPIIDSSAGSEGKIQCRIRIQYAKPSPKDGFESCDTTIPVDEYYLLLVDIVNEY